MSTTAPMTIQDATAAARAEIAAVREQIEERQCRARRTSKRILAGSGCSQRIADAIDREAAYVRRLNTCLVHCFALTAGQWIFRYSTS